MIFCFLVKMCKHRGRLNEIERKRVRVIDTHKRIWYFVVLVACQRVLLFLRFHLFVGLDGFHGGKKKNSPKNKTKYNESQHFRRLSRRRYFFWSKIEFRRFWISFSLQRSNWNRVVYHWNIWWNWPKMDKFILSQEALQRNQFSLDQRKNLLNWPKWNRLPFRDILSRATYSATCVLVWIKFSYPFQWYSSPRESF